MSKQNPVIRQRIAALRGVMEREGVSAFIVPSTDPHQSEYVAPHWMAREWISGFTGSAGTVVVTQDKAGLWTDSRYFLQAAEQLEGTGIDLYKEMLPETPSITDFLLAELKEGQRVGVDGTLLSVTAEMNLVEGLESLVPKLPSFSESPVKSIADPFDEIWPDRPPLPDAPAMVHDLKYAGRTVAEKLADIRRETKAAGADALLVSTLDEIAWTLNLRGTDVHCNPVVIAYLIVTQTEAHLFIQPQKVTPEVRQHLEGNGVTLHDYEEIIPYLKSSTDQNMDDSDGTNVDSEEKKDVPVGCPSPHDGAPIIDSILFDPAKTNHALYSAIDLGCEVVRGPSPVALLKAVRNEVEIAGLRRAMERDGVALVKFLRWLEETMAASAGQGTGDSALTELGVDRKLHALRAEQPLYVGESFDTIAGYGEHGAIVHYEATPETDIPLRPRGFLLLDSGAQYLDGTTDITRTIALGPLTDEEREDYTLILKGHIDLAMAVFPEGTRGAQLDVLARMPIWQRGMNYLHGTGHGVGHYLNVHEGPQSIRMNENPVTLRLGMLTSNEPGVYKAGSHGIRTENLVLCVPAAQGMFGRYFAFETVTLCPICTKGIMLELLTGEEIEWLNRYHRMVYDRLSPHLDSEDERSWLRNACRPLPAKR